MRRQQVHVFGDARLLAVRHAILAQIPLAEIGGDDLQVAAAVDLRQLPRWRATAQTTATAAGQLTREQPTAGDSRIRTAIRRGQSPADAWPFPLRDGEALECPLRRWLTRTIEPQQPRLRAGIEFELECLIVLPRDADASRLPHDAADAVCLALITAGVVRIEVPCGRGLASFGVDRDA